ncbi:hypothetical protein GDO78_015533 [Eleutherodactylus coqui]|uniref:Uncharacterized protein n=1 Tax=Eleutherodactylus coqui TaxID=57060 RepID=A0A8J6JWP6_ELECQ|nr:hypothetical protein GDO78_015533 [Eleutherodactylus coqui]
MKLEHSVDIDVELDWPIAGQKIKNLRDLHGIQKLLDQGVMSLLISQRNIRPSVISTMNLLCEVVVNATNKMAVLQKCMSEIGLSFNEVAYMGYSDSDVECLKFASNSGVPADASTAAKMTDSFSCTQGGSCGAIEEFAEHIISLIEGGR